MGWSGLLDRESVLLGDGVVELADAVDDVGVGGEEVDAGLLGGFECSGVAAEPVLLHVELVVVGSDGLLPVGFGFGEVDGAGLFGLAGSVSGPQPEIGVVGPGEVVVVAALGVVEGLVGVADGGVGPAAGPGVQVGPVGFDLGDLVAEAGELVGDVGRDGRGQPVPFRDQLGGAGRGLHGELVAVGDPLLAALLVPSPGEPLGGVVVGRGR